ncbi:hypothetical protein OG21DRAFT_1528214 [Imleria badia]|nr:hypothetical protein OG21DRAFT_1528214 [Imleria badia]
MHLLRMEDLGLINPSVNGGGNGSHGENHGHDLWIESERELVNEGDRVHGACSGNEVLEVGDVVLETIILVPGSGFDIKGEEGGFEVCGKDLKGFRGRECYSLSLAHFIECGGDFGIFVSVESFIDVEVNPHGFDPLGGISWFSREVGRESCLDFGSLRRHGGLGGGWMRWCGYRGGYSRRHGRGRGSSPRDSSYGGLDKGGRDTSDAGARRSEFNVRVWDGGFFVTVDEVRLSKAPKSGWNIGGEVSCSWIGGTREILDLLLRESYALCRGEHLSSLREALTKRHYVPKEEEKWTRGSR